MAQMQTLAEALAESGFNPGTPASIATVDREGHVETAVMGSWFDSRPVTEDDKFYAASLTKQVTGAAAAILVRDGQLDPDAPIARWMPDLPAWSHNITTRQLLHHTSGLPGFGALENQLPGHWTTEGVLNALHSVPAVSPGPYSYSNVGYVLLAELVAAVSGETFEAFAKFHLGIAFPADPLAMPQLKLMSSRLPLSHGDGGLWCCPRDFAFWLHRNNRDEYGIEALVTSPHADALDYGWVSAFAISEVSPCMFTGAVGPVPFRRLSAVRQLAWA